MWPHESRGPIARHLRIEGRVQGVHYRASMVREAQRLGLAGWVRNRVDGSVEALVQGDPDAVTQMLAWARQGPPQAQVTRVVETAVCARALAGFVQQATR